MQKQAQTVSLVADPRADILQLIADYQRAVKVVVEALRRQLKATNLLGAWQDGRIRQSGTLIQPRGKYSFHGVGCRFEVARRIVDVDFGPDGRYDGFDAWRLQKYASSAFEWRDFSARQIEEGLHDLEIVGLIESSKWAVDHHLFYFSADLPTPASRRPKQAK